MDWSKTKTIFIIVFSILNVFLYSLYVSRLTEADKIEPLPESSIDEKLQSDNITYAALPTVVQPSTYVRGEPRIFTGDELETDGIVSILNDRMLQVTYREPVTLDGEDADALEAFVEAQVPDGTEYDLWQVDGDQNRAVFFQTIADKPLFYSRDGQVTVFWNEEDEVIGFEQTMFDNIIENEETKELIKPLPAIHTLYQKSLLELNSRITEVELGYSMNVQLSENRQMFTPTWRIRVETEDGEWEDLFVDAIRDGVIEVNRQNEETAE